MSARKYPDELIERAAEMREQGLTFGQIGLALGMSASAVSWHCLRLGADSPNTCMNTKAPVTVMEAVRGGHLVRRFSEDEDRRILEMGAAGVRVAQIARTLGRRHNSIIGRLMTLARRENRIENCA
jgi:DNA-binding transcriptional ArsR family regulator